MASTAGLTIALVLSLFCTATIITYFVNEMNIDAEIEGIVLPGAVATYNSEQNFSSGTYDLETLSRSGSSAWIYSQNVGLVYKGGLSPDEAYLYIDNINPTSQGIITNTYIVNNSIMEDYTIVLKGQAGISNNEIRVESDGFHIPDFTILGTYTGYDNDFIPYPNANKVTTANIVTNYYDTSRGIAITSANPSTVTFTFNGQQFYSNKLNKEESFLGQQGTNRYGGIGTKNYGTTLQYFKSGNQIAGESENTDPLSNIATFLSTMITIIAWTLPETVLPLTINILLIKTQVAALAICFFAWIRGI